MSSDLSLSLYEKILLLQLDDTKGTQVGGMLHVEMGGSILAELVMIGSVTIDNDKKKKVHCVEGVEIPSDPILSEALGKIMESKKPKSARDWVQKLGGIKDLKKRAARQLVEKGVLKEEVGTVLKIFKRTVFPENNPGPEQELRRKIRNAIFTDSDDIEPGTIVVIAMAHATGLLNKTFDKKELKGRKQRIEDLVSGQAVGAATKEAVQAIQTAILVCAIMPAITTAAISSSH